MPYHLPYLLLWIALKILGAMARPGYMGAPNEVKYGTTSPFYLNTSFTSASSPRTPSVTSTSVPFTPISVNASNSIPYSAREQNSLSIRPSQTAYSSAEHNFMSYVGKHPHSVHVMQSLPSSPVSTSSSSTTSSGGSCHATCLVVNNPGNFELWTYAPGICDLDNKPVTSGVSTPPCSSEDVYEAG